MKRILFVTFIFFITTCKGTCQYAYDSISQQTLKTDTVKHIFIQYQVVAGLNKTTSRLVSESLVGYMGFLEMPTKIDPVLGFSMDLVPLLPLKSKHPVKLSPLSLYNTLLFQRYRFENANSLYDYTWSPDFPLFQDLYFLDFYYWRLSSAVKYQTKGKIFAVFATVGCTLNYIFKTIDNTRIFRDYYKNGEFRDRGPNANALVLLPLQKYELDFMGSFGAKYRRLSFELRYQLPFKETKTLLGHPASIEYLHLLCAYQINYFKHK
jgi:hypothetical protein